MNLFLVRVAGVDHIAVKETMREVNAYIALLLLLGFKQDSITTIEYTPKKFEERTA